MLRTDAFKTTEVLSTLSPIAATEEMPEGWRWRMPFGGQYVAVEMFVIEQGVRGAYRVRVSSRLPDDEWEKLALGVLGDLASFMVTDWDPITEELAGNMAAEFHLVWTTGMVAEELAAIRGAFPTEIDEKLMRWVGVVRQ
ncbi:hypothetical protein ACXHMN_04545 [Rhizobium sp. LEGMi12c]